MSVEDRNITTLAQPRSSNNSPTAGSLTWYCGREPRYSLSGHVSGKAEGRGRGREEGRKRSRRVKEGKMEDEGEKE